MNHPWKRHKLLSTKLSSIPLTNHHWSSMSLKPSHLPRLADLTDSIQSLTNPHISVHFLKVFVQHKKIFGVKRQSQVREHVMIILYNELLHISHECKSDKESSHADFTVQKAFLLVLAKSYYSLARV